MRAWHFVGASLRDGSPVPADGVLLRLGGQPIPCERGLHASEHPFDALRFAPGPHLCLVECGGVIVPHGSPVDKIACQERTIIARMDNAIEVAREQVLATPAAVSGALDSLCDPEWSINSQPREFPGRQVHDVAALCGGIEKPHVVDCTNLQPHQLLAILFCGEDRHALAALTELRCRVADELAGVIHERAAELIREAL